MASISAPVLMVMLMVENYPQFLRGLSRQGHQIEGLGSAFGAWGR